MRCTLSRRDVSGGLVALCSEVHLGEARAAYARYELKSFCIHNQVADVLGEWNPWKCLLIYTNLSLMRYTRARAHTHTYTLVLNKHRSDRKTS